MERSGGVGRGGCAGARGAWGAGAGVLLAILMGPPAQAQPIATAPLSAPATQAEAPGDYPASTSEADILRWLATRTSIPRASLLLIEPQAVVALAGRSPGGSSSSISHAEVREELIGPGAKTRSALFSVDLDCADHKFRIVARKTYALPDLRGEAQSNPEPGPWSQVNAGAPVAKAWQAVCTNDFTFPYGGQQTASAAPVVRKASTAGAAPAPIQAGAAKPPPPVRKLATAAPPPASRPAPVEASAPVVSGDFEAVLGSYTVKDNALAASEKLDTVLARDMVGRRKALVTATVKGRVFTVLTVTGFANAADASSFCRDAKAIPLDCLVKKASGG